MSSYNPPLKHNGSINTVYNPNDYLQTNPTLPYLPLPGGTITGLLTATRLALSSTNVALGLSAGASGQSFDSVAMGQHAGETNQGSNAFAMGAFAGQTSQGNACVALGANAGTNNQLSGAVAIGNFAGFTSQGGNAIAIGGSSGYTSQPANNIAIGLEAGSSQGTESVAIGYNSGRYQSGTRNTFVGTLSGYNNNLFLSGANNTYLGYNTGSGTVSASYSNCVAVGSGALVSGDNAVAIGSGAISASGSVAVGRSATTSTFTNATAIGTSASVSGNNGVAIGNGAISGANQITLGSTSVGETVRLNTITPLYSSIPSLTSSQIGYVFTGQSFTRTVLSTNPGEYLITAYTLQLPIGVYVITGSFSINNSSASQRIDLYIGYSTTNNPSSQLNTRLAFDGGTNLVAGWYPLQQVPAYSSSGTFSGISGSTVATISSASYLAIFYGNYNSLNTASYYSGADTGGGAQIRAVRVA